MNSRTYRRGPRGLYARVTVANVSLGQNASIVVLLEDASLPVSVKSCGPLKVEYFEGMDPAFSLGETSRYTFDFLTSHTDLARVLSERNPRLVFNLCDQGFRNDPRKELHIPALCEVLGIPCTGATPTCLALAFDKIVASTVARSVGVPTPLETLLGSSDGLIVCGELSFPLLVKPNFADGSFGIFGDSVVHNGAELSAYLARVRDYALGPLLLQEYLPGAEYCVVAVGNVDDSNFRVLPIVEKDYSAFGNDYPPITGFEVKWWSQGEPFPYDLDLRPATMAREEHALIERHVANLFRRFECRDYAKFDFRKDAAGNLRLIDVNPNFDLFSDSLMLMAELAGQTHAAIIDDILDAAIHRYARGVNQSG